MESSPSTLGLQKLIDLTAPGEAPIVQAQSKSMNYKKKVLSVKKAESLDHKLCYSRKGLLRVLTWSTEKAPNTYLGSKEEVILPVTKTLLNLHKGLEPFSHPLGVVV